MQISHVRVSEARHLCGLLALATLLLFAAGTASARTYMLSLTGITNQVETDAAVHQVEFSGGANSIDITLFHSATVVAYFSAECSVGALDNQTWLDIDIRANGAAAAPTQDNNALCTSKSVLSSNGRWVSASTDAVISLGPGSYTIDVTARLSGFSPGESWRLNETTFVIVVQETD